MNEEIFNESRLEVEKLLALMEEGRSLFPKRLVPEVLLQQGLTYYKGLVVPTSSVSHKYLYDDYEVPFLEGFIALFKKLLEDASSVSNEFAFRTLLEMGSENSFIILDKRVDKDDKKLFILVSLLADYSSIETSMRTIFNEWLTKLYQENVKFLRLRLSEGDIKTLEELIILLKNAKIDFDQYTILLKSVRQLLSKVKSDLLNKYNQKKVFGLNDGYKRMKSGEAHMLHGNAFLIMNRMKQQSKENHLFRVYAYLTISGIDLLNCLSSFLNNQNFSKKVEDFNKEHNVFKLKFKSAWEKTKPIK
jgi:hypothetical protein